MKSYTYYNVILSGFVAILVFNACHTNQKLVEKPDVTSKTATVPTQNKCVNNGKVVDFSNVDGCNYFIQLPDSTFLQPVENGVENFRLEPEQQLQFSYEILPDMMSICSVNSKAIKLTCATVLNAAELKIKNPEVFIECFDVEIPNDAPWLKKILIRSKPINITKYAYFYNEKAYIIRFGNNSALYDCRGVELFKGDNRACQKLVIDAKNGHVIYQAEGAPE